MNIRDAIQAELGRLGLAWEDLPAGGLASRGDDFLKRLRTFAPGLTWQDVLPDLPPHWLQGRTETWTTPYRPLGPYDYQELPTGPAVMSVGRSQASRISSNISSPRPSKQVGLSMALASWKSPIPSGPRSMR